MTKTDNEPMQRVMDHIREMLEASRAPLSRAMVIASTARTLRMTLETVRRQVRQLAAAGEALPFHEIAVEGKRYLALRAEADPDPDPDPDTRAQCGGCSKRITPGVEYHRDDGKVYHNGCVDVATTRPLNPPQTAHAAPQQAGKLIAGVGVQLGAGRPQ